MKRMPSMIGIVAVAAAVSGCGPSSVPAPTATPAPRPAVSPTPVPSATPSAAAPAIALDAEGLRLVDMASGRTRPVAFGTPRAATLAALASRGVPQVGINAECGAGPLRWARFADGLTVQFQDEAFVGWSVDAGSRGKVTTMSGIGPGSTRAELEDVYAITLPESTLGTEFAAGAMGGLLDGPGPSARITDLWAGTTCLFR